MAAPLHSRFKRFCERDTRPFKEHTPFRYWKNKALVYSLTDTASSAMREFALQPPGELLAQLREVIMPGERVWVEYAFREHSANSVVSTYEEDSPIRQAFLFETFTDDPSRIHAYVYNLYPTGKTFMMPVACTLDLDGKAFKQHLVAVEGKDVPEYAKRRMLEFGVGYHYCEVHRSDPNLRPLLDHAQQGIIVKAMRQDILEGMMETANGTARLAICCLIGIGMAKRRKYRTGTEEVEIPRDPKPSDYKRVYEVDLFLTPKVNVRKHVINGQIVDRKKPGRHPVRGHWAYRSRRDGLDPRVCHVSPGGLHDWEDVEGTKSQVCVLCAQKRWIKPPQVRGEGDTLSPVVYNVHG